MTAVPPNSQTLVTIYEKMTTIKLNDDRFIAELKAGRMAMPYYSARGQEAISAGVNANLRDEDYIVTIYRGIHDMLGKGVPPKLLWAEIAGKATGACKGKGGPMHITHPASGCMVTTGVVGASMPIACGLGLASQLREDGRVTVANFGDGASNIGAFHESLNLASVWNLPVVFVCQNNLYAEHTPMRQCTAIDRISDRAASYTMPGVHVDGNDPIAVYEAAREAVARAREGGGPTLIEAVSFRFNGHVMGDAGDYIPKEEYAAAMQRDPYPIFRSHLLEHGYADEAALAAIDAKVRAEIEDAVRFAYDSPFPELIELRRDVFAHEMAEA